MPDLASELSRIPDMQRVSPWADHEFARGWGIFSQPFDSGDVLGLRIFPQGTFGGYRAVWHSDAAGRWSIHVDGPRLDTACPRYVGPAIAYAGYDRIHLEWTGPMALSITVEDAGIEWSVRARESPALRVVNAVHPRLPDWTWRAPSLVHARDALARALGMGRDFRLAVRMPSGHDSLMMPDRMYYVDDAHARIGDRDLGATVRLRTAPRIGDVPFPARGVLAVGRVFWRITDPDEHTRARAALESLPGPRTRRMRQLIRR